MKQFLFLTILLFAYTAGIAQEGFRQRAVRIKLTPETETKLQKQTVQRTAGGILQTGVKTIDDLNVRYGATEWRRVFPDAGEFEEKHRRYGLHLWYELVIKQEANVLQAASDYSTNSGISVAEPVAKVVRIANVSAPLVVPVPNDTLNARRLFTANDPYFSAQWNYNNTGQAGTAGVDIRLLGAWENTRGSRNIIVSVVDGGIDVTHPDIMANYAGGKNFVTGGGVTADEHGTHVAGTVAAVTNNDIGVAGVAGGSGNNDGTRLLSCQVFEGDNSTAIGPAIAYGADYGAVISQNSWGYEQEGVYNQSDRDAINYFIREAGKNPDGSPRQGSLMAGGIVIFAAGNNNSNGNWYPGAWDEVIAVAAVGPTGKRAYYSNYGTWVDISAPGGDARVNARTIYSTLPDSQYGYMQGTSMACPHVSATAALILSVYGSNTYTPAQLRQRLLASVRPLEWDPAMAPYMGSGLIDASKAVGEYIPATGVSVSPATASVMVGRTTTLTANVSPQNASNKNVTWTSNNTGIATVSMTGVVTGVAEGTTKIIATTVDGNFTAVTNLTVSAVRVVGVTVSPASYNLSRGTTRELRATISPSDATNKSVNWQSSDPEIASVSATGTVTGLQLGTVQIIATTADGGFQSVSDIQVVQQVTGVSITPPYLKVVNTDNATLTAVIEPADAFNKGVIWTSNRPTVVGVNENGVLSTRSSGTATIKVYTDDGGYEATCNVTVTDDIQGPQGFSPNGDDINDYFVMALDSRETYKLQVYDRSGQLYYETDDYKNDWDGTANTGFKKGSKVKPGTYFYTIQAKNGTVKRSYVVIKY